jgi:hypothetical protein
LIRAFIDRLGLRNGRLGSHAAAPALVAAVAPAKVDRSRAVPAAIAASLGLLAASFDLLSTADLRTASHPNLR